MECLELFTSVNPTTVEMNELMFPKSGKDFEVKCTVGKSVTKELFVKYNQLGFSYFEF